jgi:UDP-glucose 4-epimerase
LNVLVLGANGLFGGKTVLRLLRDSEVECVVSMVHESQVKDWVIKSFGENKDKFHTVRGDISELEDILNAIKTYSIDRIVNWAFQMPGIYEFNPRFSTKVNALGMCNFFEAASLMGIQRVVYASTAGVYGPQDEYGDREVTEDDHLHPGSGYALMKQYAEILAQQYSELYDLKPTGLRIVVGYGHGRRTTGPVLNKWFSEMISLVAVGKPFSIDMDGTNQASLVSSDDVAELTRILLHLPSSPHPVYNVGGPPASLKDIADAVLKYIPNASIQFGNQPPPDMSTHGIPYKISMARVKEDLNYTLLPTEEAVLIHINDARLEAGLEPIRPKV